MFALAAISLSNGILGADFTELPRPRMIRTRWSLINLVECALAALAIVAPLIPTMFTLSAHVPVLPTIDPYQALVISAAITVIIAFVAYRAALKSAKELLAKAEI
jgi:hypothetical protein